VCRRWRWLLVAQAADRGGAQMQAGAGQHLGNLDLAEAWTECLQTLHGVDRHGGAQQRGGSVFVEALAPGGDGCRGDLEYPCRLCWRGKSAFLTALLSHANIENLG
jgi:hypothetical protein